MSSRTFSGLSRLGSINPSRRIKDPEELEEEEVYEPDFKNTSNEQNLPVATAEGGISPESFDVRANKVINTEEEKIPNYENLGRQLGNVIPQPKETELSNEQKYVQPNELGELGKLYRNENKSEEVPFLQRAARGIKNFLGDISSPTKPFEKIEYPENENKIQTPIEKNIAAPNPGEYEKNILSAEEEQSEKIKIAQENPWTVSVYGSTDEIASSPELQREFTTITGQNWDEEIAQTLKTYEEALAPYHEEINKVKTEESADATRIRERIESNKSTDMDKYYIGLSLALPLIIGGFFGAEAGLAALGGAAKGLGDAQNRRREEIMKDEELLADINKKRSEVLQNQANVLLKQQEFPQEIRKNLPTNPLAHLEGSKAIPYKDPDTGQIGKAPEISNDLFVKPNLVNTKEKEKEKRQEAKALSEVKTYVDGLDKLSSQAIDIISQLPDKTIFKQLFVNAIKGVDSTGLLSKISDQVMIDGRKENAGIALNSLLGLIATKYANAYKLGQLDAEAQRHINKIINNPESSFASPQDAIHQLLIINRDAQNGLLDSATNQGFIADIWREQFNKSRDEVYGKLNKKEEKKETEKRKLAAVRNQ